MKEPEEGTVGSLPLLALPQKEDKSGWGSGASGKATSSKGSQRLTRLSVSVSLKDESAATVIVMADGRSCGCCTTKDTTMDYVNKKTTSKWGRNAIWNKTKKCYINDGAQCHYCVKIHNSHYKHKKGMKQIADFEKVLHAPTDEGVALKSEFDVFRETVVKE